MTAGIDYAVLAATQEKDEEMQAYCTVISVLVLEDIRFGPVNTTLLSDVCTGQLRPIVPASWPCRIFEVVHGLSHSSIRATKILMAARFMWHVLRKQVGK